MTGKVTIRSWPAALFVLVIVPGAARAQVGGDDPAERLEAIAGLIRSVSAPSESPSVLAGIDPAKAPAEAKAVARALRGTRVDLVFEKTSLRDAIEVLRRSAGFNVAYSAKARAAIDEEGPRLTIALRGVTAENALDLIAVALGSYRFVVQYGAVVVVRKEEYRPKTFSRLYDVTDLIRKKTDFPAPPLALGDGSAEPK